MSVGRFAQQPTVKTVYLKRFVVLFRFNSADASIDGGYIVYLLFLTLFLGGYLEERVVGDVCYVDCLRTARTCAEHKVHNIIVAVDIELLGIPCLTAGGRGG